MEATTDERFFRIVARLLAQTLRARSLASDLQTSRGEAIAAIEEERRRICGDLHDGLGPTLSGIASRADAARNSLDDRGAADAPLRALRGEAANAVAEIRRLVYEIHRLVYEIHRLVYGMRPPTLDEVGLVGALRQSATQSHTAERRQLIVDIQAPDQLGDLPAAVEVAAYRIAGGGPHQRGPPPVLRARRVRRPRAGDELQIEGA